MKGKKAIKKRVLTALSIIAAAFLIAAIAGYVLLTGGASIQSRAHTALVHLNGLKPGAVLNYVVHTNADSVSGSLEADEYGNMEALKIPATLTLSEAGDKTLIDLELAYENEIARLTMQISPDIGFSCQGQGFDAFSDIALGGLELKTDWAGLFSWSDSQALQTIKAGQPYQIAFRQSNVMSDAQDFATLTIEAYAAPGGGGPTGGGVNEFLTPYCVAPPYYSFCLSQVIQSQIDNIVKNLIEPLQFMAEQLSAVMMQYIASIGFFIDAKYQLETQLTIERLKAEAHKDYHPSEQMCRFGSFVKSIPRAEEKMALDKRILNRAFMNTALSVDYAATSQEEISYMPARIKQFREIYCDPKDNNNGLQFMCEHDQDGTPSNGPVGGQDPERLNKDIDFLRTAYRHLTLDVDFSDDTTTEDEEDILALMKNVYWAEPFSIADEKRLIERYSPYLASRHYVAQKNVANNSFAHYIAMKARSKAEIDYSGWRFMKSMMREFGLEDQEIDELLGEYPSYYAQMEVLTKKIFQNPDFYTNLYDKPVNVQRIGTAMEAIKLMQMRDLYEAALRREMLNSVMLDHELSKLHSEINQFAADSGF